MTTGDEHIVTDLSRPRRRWPGGGLALIGLILAPFIVAIAAFGWRHLLRPQPEFSYPYRSRQPLDLRFSPDGKLIAACDWSGGLTILRVADGQRIAAKQSSAPIARCAWNSKGTSFVGASRECEECDVWDSKTWKLKRQLRSPVPAKVTLPLFPTGLAIDQHESVYLTTNLNGDPLEDDFNPWGSQPAPKHTLVWWGQDADVSTPASIGQNDDSQYDVSTATIGGDTLVAIAYTAHSVEIFKISYNRLGRAIAEKQFQLPRTQETRIQLSSDGRFLAARNAATFLVFQLTGQSNPKLILSRDDDFGQSLMPYMKLLDLSSDGQIAAYQAKERVVVLHIPEGRVLLEVPSKANAIAVSPDGRLFAIPTGSQLSFYRVPAAR